MKKSVQKADNVIKTEIFTYQFSSKIKMVSRKCLAFKYAKSLLDLIRYSNITVPTRNYDVQSMTTREKRKQLN